MYLVSSALAYSDSFIVQGPLLDLSYQPGPREGEESLHYFKSEVSPYCHR